MSKTRLEQLVDVFETAKGISGSVVAVVVEKQGFSKPEVIVNHYENIDGMIAFYKEQYDNDLNHKFSRIPISIVDFMWARDFEHLSRFFLTEK